MRKLFRSRRGSVAFATSIALVPLVGFMAIGGEAGSWYVTKQRAQSAADAAAYSGALRLQCGAVQTSGGPACADAQNETYRARQFAAQNAFCDGTDTSASSYPGARCPTGLPSGTSQQVTVAVGATQVQATVSQTQPTYMAKLLGLSNVTIAATAIARVLSLSPPCVLSLQDPLTFQGNTTVNSPNCGLSSNNTSSSAIQFTGSSVNSNVKSLSAPGGCAQNGSVTPCDKAITYAAATPNPLSGLDAPMAAVSIATNCPSGNNVLPTAYDTTKSQTCVNNGFTFKSNGGPTNDGRYPLNGVYFFSGNLTIQGGTITGTATFILLPGASLKISGNPTIQLSPVTTVLSTQVPTQLRSTSVLNLMSKLLIYDPESTGNNQSVTISGSTTSYFNGVVYAPNADVLYQGSSQNYGCNMVIAKGVALSGSSNFDNSTCPATSAGAVTRYVRLVP